MMKSGAEVLKKNVEHVNALNVFPVPDGDTGTNMSLTIASGIKEMEKSQATEVGQMAKALSKGLLMGARGNSGVILSQLFRGFARALAGKETINARQFADAFYQGVETAYQAVIKPVEGTVLTVAREAADAAIKISWTASQPIEIMQTLYDHALKTLAQTPEMLSVLEEVNVVDAGGQGLVYIYEGMLLTLKGETIEPTSPTSDIEQLIEEAHQQNAQVQIDPARIEQGYCTEFMIDWKTSRREVNKFEEKSFRKELAQFGDSLLVVADDDWIKVHIHTESPGDVLNYAIQFGDLSGIKIENMREQYKQVTSEEKQNKPRKKPSNSRSPYRVLVVAAGDGVAEIFSSLGADQVIQGGQSMNPSAEEIVKAIESLNADHVFVFPNNKNVIATAKQAATLVDQSVTVVETKTIPQGMAALVAFDKNKNPEENLQRIQEQIASIRTGEVTHAVRDSEINGQQIKKGDYLGILDGDICCNDEHLFGVLEDVIANLIQEDTDVVTLIVGQDASMEETEQWIEKLQQQYEDQEFEIYDGGQPLYYFLIGAE